MNNLIYVVDTSASANGTTTKRGIRLVNGGKVPDGGLTIVSGNPVYVQGDYNTGTVGTTRPPSSAASSPDPHPAYRLGLHAPTRCHCRRRRHRPLQLVDRLAAGTVPTASNTTINAAFISAMFQAPMDITAAGWKTSLVFSKTGAARP